MCGDGDQARQAKFSKGELHQRLASFNGEALIPKVVPELVVQLYFGGGERFAGQDVKLQARIPDQPVVVFACLGQCANPFWIIEHAVAGDQGGTLLEGALVAGVIFPNIGVTFKDLEGRLGIVGRKRAQDQSLGRNYGWHAIYTEKVTRLRPLCLLWYISVSTL